MSVYDNIKQENRMLYLSELLKTYVDQQGLGAMPKSDLDALVLHLFIKYSKRRFNSFELSGLFKVTESRVKTLLEIAAVKFETSSEQDIWMTIIRDWKSSITEVSSIEKGQVVFKFENPGYFRYIQKETRAAGGTVTYSKNAEAITISLATLFAVLDSVYGRLLSDKAGHQALLKDLLQKIKTDLIGPNKLQQLKDDKQRKTRLAQILTNASNLSSIGSLIVSVFGL
jgi:hypothetical protein